MSELRDVQTWCSRRVFMRDLVVDEVAFATALRLAPDDVRASARRAGMHLLDVPAPRVAEMVDSVYGPVERGSFVAMVWGTSTDVCGYLYEWRCPAVADV